MSQSLSDLSKFNNSDRIARMPSNYGVIFNWLAWILAVPVFVFSLLKGGVSPESIINAVSTRAVLFSAMVTFFVVLAFDSIGSVISAASDQQQGGVPRTNGVLDYAKPFFVLSIVLLLLPIGESSFLQKGLIALVHFIASNFI